MESRKSDLTAQCDMYLLDIEIFLFFFLRFLGYQPEVCLKFSIFFEFHFVKFVQCLFLNGVLVPFWLVYSLMLILIHF